MHKHVIQRYRKQMTYCDRCGKPVNLSYEYCVIRKGDQLDEVVHLECAAPHAEDWTTRRRRMENEA